jgi:hypothetical protein
MKIVTGSTVASMAALLIGIASAANAQQPGNAGLGLSGTQWGSANQAGAAGMSAGTGLSPSPTPGLGTSAGATGQSNSGPVLNNMRANGTSLDMNPDPRAPNVTGKAAPRR